MDTLIAVAVVQNALVNNQTSSPHLLGVGAFLCLKFRGNFKGYAFFYIRFRKLKLGGGTTFFIKKTLKKILTFNYLCVLL